MCSLSHKEVWKLTSKLLTSFVSADKYIVYVPETELQEFLTITPKNIEVRTQESLSNLYFREVEDAVIASNNQKRFGWYLQQFNKIQALIESESELTTIWDADCVPVKLIELITPDEIPIFMNASNELHQPYFEAIQRLLGMERVQNQSFVVPGFPMKKNWIKEFVEYVEDRNNRMSWFESIIASTDFSLISGFSETETLGTWIANRYPNDWQSRPKSWERFGQSQFGHAGKMSPKKLVRIANRYSLDIVSFENWDTLNTRKYLYRFRRRLKLLRKTLIADL